MNIHSTASNYFRSGAHVGIRQKIDRSKAFDLPGGLLLWKAAGKIIVLSLPLILAVNLWCSSAISTKKVQLEEMSLAVVQLQERHEVLQKRVDRLASPVRVKIAAAEKLSLFEPKPTQIYKM